MKDVFQVVSTVIIIGLSAVTVWLMLEGKKGKAGCGCKGEGKKEGIQPPSCGIGWRGPSKKTMTLVK